MLSDDDGQAMRELSLLPHSTTFMSSSSRADNRALALPITYEARLYAKPWRR